MSGLRRARTGSFGAALATLLLLSACGLPGQGSASQVDDETVPYDLLDPAATSSASSGAPAIPGSGPLVFWLIDDERLVPSATDASCAQSADVVVERLLDDLVAGPSTEERDAGRSTAVPPGSELALVDLTDGSVQVEIEPDTTISADRLPAALGQIVLTVTSVAGVRSVTLVSDGAPVSMPLPGGVLTDGPVTAEDYSELLPGRFQDLTDLGCPV